LFHPEEDLRRTIYEILGSEGKSISALSKELEKRGFKIHRLVLTGYLRALADIRLLREYEVPPAKLYIPAKTQEKDIYSIIGEKARTIASGEKANALILYTLCKLFKRPIFEDELKRAGVEDRMPGRIATTEERQEAKKVLSKAGWKIPDSVKAYLIEDETLKEASDEIIKMIVLDFFDAWHMVKETTQTKLSI